MNRLAAVVRLLAEEARFCCVIDAEVALEDFNDKVPCDPFYHRVAERLLLPLSPGLRNRIRSALRQRHSIVKSNTHSFNFLRYAHAWRLTRGAPKSALDRDL